MNVDEISGKKYDRAYEKCTKGEEINEIHKNAGTWK
jgi:hypothetical protein